MEYSRVIEKKVENTNVFAYGLKRFVDICAGIVGCLILIPLTCIVFVLNRVKGDKGPIFFCQKRIGLNGNEFNLYKYRTMVENADLVLEDLMKKDPKVYEEYTVNKKLVNDPRITLAGKFLRKTSLDEFPQFINILLGDMSLVGPRPYLPREKEDMGLAYTSIIQCKPGLTGYWQSHGRSDVSFKNRLLMDVYYNENYSLRLDLDIIFKTFRSVLLGIGAK